MDVLATTNPTPEQSACAAGNHGSRNACHCDGPEEGGPGPGFVCNDCGFHGHYA